MRFRSDFPKRALLVFRAACLGVLAGMWTAASAEVYQASVTVDTARLIGPIDPDIYGQYLEHVDEKDECIYPSIWDDTSRFADSMGLRRDVIEAARSLEVPVIRWPGGCFADVYHWENGIGPRNTRPTVKNLHWGGEESHQFGTDEFLQWCQLLDAKPYINVNLGSGTLAEALRWLEYCNGAADTPQGKRRAANGHRDPYNVSYWGIGNETWGPWETGHTNAQAYATMLAEWAAAFRKQDPSIKILAVGSYDDPAWDREVVRQAGHLIDYLTIHIYGSTLDYSGTNYEAVAFTPCFFDIRIRRMLETIDETSAKVGLKRPVQLSLDEWNNRHHHGKKVVRKAPRTVQDAVFVSGVLNVMLRHSPRVSMGNYVFLVNGHAPLLVNGDSVVQTPIFYVFQQYGRWMKGQTVAITVNSPMCEPPSPYTGGASQSKSPQYQTKEAPYLDSVAAKHEDGTLAIALLNRHQTDAADVELKLPDGYRVVKSWRLEGPLYAVNDFENPNRIVPVEAAVTQPTTKWRCQPHSLTMLLCSRAN